MSGTLGRRLPEGARFVTVSELYDMLPEDLDRTQVWTPVNGKTERYSGWMPARTVVNQGGSRQVSFAMAPSSLVVVVRTEPT